MALIGEQRHRNFRAQNLGPSVSKKEEWGKLKFLQELLLCEKLMLDHKTATLMGLCSNKDEGKIDKSRNWSSSSHTVDNESMECPFCGKQGHAVVTTAKGNKIIPYYLCETFVGMSPSERFSELRTKNFCTSCIFPGAVKGLKQVFFYKLLLSPSLT